MKNFPVLLLIPLTLYLSCQSSSESNPDETITVFCAAGLSPAVSEFIKSYDTLNSIRIRLNIGSSGTLARQIEQGNLADIYISANTRWANYISEKGDFDKPETLCQNQLAFVAPVNSKLDSFPLSHEFDPTSVFDSYLSIGDPDHVPAGEYSLQALVSLGWDSILNTRFLPTQDVRAALRPVEMGECELGIVYYSEAYTSDKVKIVAAIPDSLHDPIQFQVLLSKDANMHIRQFYTRLTDPKNKSLWQKYGFSAVY